MLGTTIDDDIESGAGRTDGLGLLPLTTVFAHEKLLRRVSGTVWGLPATGYEIRHGRVSDDEPLVQRGHVLGTAWHGLLETDAVRRALLAWVAERTGPRLDPRHPPLRRRPRSAPRPPRGLVRRAHRRPRPTRTHRKRRPGRAARDPARRRRVLRLLTTADTEILAAAHAVQELGDDFPEVRAANPSTLEDIAGFTRGAHVVVVRLLGGRRAWPEGVATLRALCERDGIALILLGGEAEPDAELAELSLAPAGAVAQAFEYLRHGGVDNTRELLRFLADTFGLTGHGFEAPQDAPRRRLLPSARRLAIPRREPDGRPRRRRRLLPLALRHRQHRVRRRARERDRARRRPADLPVDVLAARRRARPAAARRQDRRAGHHRARLRRLARGRRVARGGAGGARRPGHPGAVRDDVKAALGRVRLRPDPARRRDAGRDPRVRRAHRRRADLLQGADPRARVRGAALRARPRALRPARPPRGQPRAAQNPRPQRAAAPRSSSARFPTKHARVGNAVGLDTPASAMALLEALSTAGHRVENDVRGRRRAHPRADRRPAATTRSSSPTTSCGARPRGSESPNTPSVVRLAPRRAARARPGDLGPGAGRVVRRRRRLRHRRPGARQRLPRHPAAARLRREPGRDLPRPEARARPSLPRHLPLARPSASTRSSTSASTARSSGCRARRSASPTPARPTPASPTSRSSTRSWSTTPARACRPSAAPTRS